jgi:ribonuclease HII
MRSKPIIRGDSSVYRIALASILAKVARDEYMISMDSEYPNYGFAQHKGYGTQLHLKAIHKYGPSPIHRMSFKPLKGRDSTPLINTTDG